MKRNRVIHVIEEVGAPGADTYRHNRSRSVFHRTQRVGVEPVVETESGPFQTLPGVVRLLHWTSVDRVPQPKNERDGFLVADVVLHGAHQGQGGAQGC